ncbi:murein hydrolase activator EnvC family protein [Terricaulis sp.]|uniref:murein hydrolase activator EnvC family protein n=1 Tax=Terricaulis sp. TaxID=2768686 RepID=UPI0037839C51
MASGAVRAGVLVACAAGALAIFLGAANAQPAQRTQTQVERERRAEQTRAERLRRQAEAARTEIRALDRRLVESGRRRAEAEAAAADAEDRLAALRDQVQTDTQRFGNERDAFEAAIIAAAMAEHRLDFTSSRRATFARAAAPQLYRQQRDTALALRRAQQLDLAITREQQVIADAQAQIDMERAELVTLVARRRAVQTTLVSDAAAADARVRRLAAESRTLRELAERVQASARRGSQTGPRGGGAGTIPAAWLAPAEGRVIRNFGAREAGGPAAQGATVRTRGSAQVVSPAAGEVAYAGLFRSYGQVLILNLDGGYALVLTGLENVRAQVGDRVQSGQPIGEMPSSDTPAPELYVEVRRNGQPIDPARWLNNRGLAAEQATERNG